MQAKGDVFRSKSYSKGSAAIAAHSEKVTSGIIAKKLAGVGKVRSSSYGLTFSGLSSRSCPQFLQTS